MGKCLSYAPNEAEINCKTKCYSVGVCSMRGCRKTMQDRYKICLSFPNHPKYSLFGIFDGFNGHSASEYLSKNLVHKLNKLDTLNDDELIINEINKMDQTFLKSRDENINCSSGSTIVFALIENISKPIYQNQYPMVNSVSTDVSDTLPLQPYVSSCESQTHKARIFWVGDSGAISIQAADKFERLTTEHHCDLKDELRRIKKASGEIINNKIDGVCGLSRCFGCKSMKNNKSLPHNQQKMISVAQCKHISFESEETLILFSDGVTQKWDDDKLIKNYNFHHGQHKNYKNPLRNTLIHFIEACIDGGSKDNITAISIKFE